jgi:hypothetical protein
MHNYGNIKGFTLYFLNIHYVIALIHRTGTKYDIHSTNNKNSSQHKKFVGFYFYIHIFLSSQIPNQRVYCIFA